MVYADLRAWIDRLEREGELARVRVEVDPVLEAACIADRCVKATGAEAGRNKALLFERVKGATAPLLMNQFGTERRMCLALGVESLDDLGAKVAEIVDRAPPAGWWERLKTLPDLAHLAAIFPRTVRSGPCQEVVREGERASVEGLPIPTTWPLDAGPFVTFGCVFVREPDSDRPNCGMYRLQVFDPRTLAFHSHRHHTGGERIIESRRRGEKFPVAVAIGTDPAVTFASVAPCPPGVDEMILAGFLRGAGVEMVRCRTVPLEVPATAEVVLEGWVDPAETRTEGPFGDHTGFYSEAEAYPVLRLSCVTHRRDPIYAATIVGPPPMEDCWMGRAIERMFLPLLRKLAPEIVDYRLPFEGVFHNLVLVSIRKRHPGQARKVMHALWGAGQMAFAKVIVVVDEDVDVRDPSKVAFEALAHIDPARDLEFAMGPVDVLDHASRAPGYGSKVGVDATRKLPEEGHTRPWPRRQEWPADLLARVADRWRAYGIGGD